MIPLAIAFAAAAFALGLWLADVDTRRAERQRHADTVEALAIARTQRDAWRRRALYWHGEYRRDVVGIIGHHAPEAQR